MNEFTGSWVRRGGIMVPVLEPQPEKITCKVCGSPGPAALCRPCRESVRERVHGSHAGFNQHMRRFEQPCADCVTAERVYQKSRYRRGQLSKTDLAWCEKQAVVWSWVVDTRTNRRASVANTS